jgi:uncharacterized protein YjdB
MTFKHKLARRLALLKDRKVALPVALLATALVFACEKPLPLSSTGTATVADLVISPKNVTVHENDSVEFTAAAFMSTGDTANVTVSWSSTTGTITDMGTSPNGKRHYGQYKAGKSTGQYNVVATGNPGSVADTATITITLAPVAAVGVAPSSATIVTGATLQLQPTLTDSAGNVLTGRTITWSSNNGPVATVSSSGLVTAAGTGSATITATSEGQSGTAGITVTTVPVASVTVAPATLSLQTGQTGQLTATPKDANGNSLSGRVVTWSSNNTSVATVNGSGLVTAGATSGSATITATSEGQSGTATANVTFIPVASVTVSPASASPQVGQTTQLTATPKDASGNPLSGRAVTWSSNNTTVATVNGTGLVSAKAAGSATITATSEGQSGTASITVTQVPVATVTVSPASASVQVGSTVQLSATTKDANGNILTGRTVTWSSSDTTIAKVGGTGLVTGQGAGSATITATSEGKSGSAAITVTAQPPPGTHTGWYVTTNGSSGGSGTATSPWDFSTALNGGNGKVQPGDTIWVRGGTYTGTYSTNLNGTASAPIIVRAYPLERVTIDANGLSNDAFVTHGSYTWYWGFEFTNSDPTRVFSTISSSSRPDVVVNNGTHMKYINLVVHDGGVGFYTYTNMPDVEIYGAIVYNNGWQASDRGHGHGLYLKNDVGPVVARDNVIFNQFGYGIHIYTDGGAGLLNNISAIGNISFDNGSLASTGPSAEIGNLGQPPANNLVITNNMTYVAPSVGGSNVDLGSGDGLTATGNYVVGGAGISQGSWTNATVANNTVIPPNPGQTAVFVRPNAYEPGRAYVAVYNWGGLGSVSVDLSGVVKSGAQYVIMNVQDLFGTPVATGTYGGGSVSIPIIAVPPPVPIGITSLAPTTGPLFNVFVVTSK